LIELDLAGFNLKDDWLFIINLLYFKKNLRGLLSFKENHKITGVTDADIDELFTLYWSL